MILSYLTEKYVLRKSMASKIKAIIVDLDGTLSNSEHRNHFVDRDGRKDFKSFCDNLIYDPPNEWCVSLINAMYKDGIMPLYVTGRSDEYRELTLQWFHNNFSESKHPIVLHNNYVSDNLYMRPANNYDSDVVIKTDIYNSKLKDKYDIIFCIDDRKKISSMWRSLGLVCLHCAEGEF